MENLGRWLGTSKEAMAVEEWLKEQLMRHEKAVLHAWQDI